MAKDPAFLFYSSDFLSGVSDLTMEERGQYITLLCIQHQKGHISRKTVGIAVPNATADVLAKFSIDEDGMFFNERLEEEANKRKNHCLKQKERAKKGWEKRKAKADATALPLENEDENENRIEKENKNEIVYPFNSEKFKNHWKLWKDYKEKEFSFKYKSTQSEQGALTDLANKSKNNEDVAIKIINQSFSNGWKGFFNIKSNGKTSKVITDDELVDAYRRKYNGANI